jgi:hypothetical protein
MSERFTGYEKITTESIDEHKKKLEDQMADIQLRFLDLKMKAAVKGTEKADFDEYLDTYTTFTKNIVEDIKHWDPDLSDEEVANKIAPLKAKLREVYESGEPNWIEEIIKIIKEAKKIYGEGKPNTKVEKPRFGLIEVDEPRRVYTTARNDIYKQYGISDLDEVLEIHVAEAYENPNNKITAESFKKSLESLAEAIVDNYPQVSAVVGTSWLINTPLSKRLGFHELNIDIKQPYSQGFWLQFIDKNGQINQERVAEFLASGKSEYDKKSGYIPVLEFLNRYLPESKRGKIILKEVNKEKVRENEAIKTEVSDIKTNWVEILDVEIEKVIKEKSYFMKFLVEKGLLDQVIEILKTEKQKGHNWETVRNHPVLQKIGEMLKQNESEGLYREIEVEIPAKGLVKEAKY